MKLPWSLPTRIPLRLRIFFRGAFLLLVLATLGLALTLLREEKELSYANYQEGFRKTQSEIAARLRHPTGQLALLNPRSAIPQDLTPLRPLLLPFSAIDFDDRAKVQQAVEMAGCLVQYGAQANLCVAVGSNPLAGGFIYAAGSFTSGDLAPHLLGDRDLTLAHRLWVQVQMRGQVYRWLAPFEAESPNRGRLTGFAENADGTTGPRPVRDFRGWLWREGDRSFYSLRLPIELFREALTQRDTLVWPPADLENIRVHLKVLAPGDEPALFDSNSPQAHAPFALQDLTPLLLPGETLSIRRQGREIASLTGAEAPGQPASPWLLRLIRKLPVEGYDNTLEASDSIATPLGAYELRLRGDVRSVNRTLGAVAARMVGFVGAMLAAVLLTWLAIELRMMSRITLLTRRAASLSRDVKEGAGPLRPLALEDLRGSDELGLLAGVLAELMQRVNEDLRREQLRAAQEKEQWHAVGHEIMSPLQSLMVLHPGAEDASHRYIQRMQQAVRVLYGSASPSEAFEGTSLALQGLDVDQFLRHVADNAVHAGIEAVEFESSGEPLMVRGDEYALEDAVTHVLANAQRYREPGTAIRLSLSSEGRMAQIRIHNSGPAIDEARLEQIFEYGESDAAPDAAHRGQGLFVARTYMAKMGGTVVAVNEGGGVSFVLSLPLS